MLKFRWGEFERLRFDRGGSRQAEDQIPFTNSPFPTLLRDLNDFIEKDQDSKFSFIELELRMRVTMPNFSVSTGRNDSRVIADSLSILGVSEDGLAGLAKHYMDG